MALKTVKRQADESGDILGLVAFGSLVANIFQIASKKSLEEEHVALKVYAGELKKHYENMRVRERLVYKENIELRNCNKELQNLNSRLLKELIEAKTLMPIKKIAIHKSPGGSK